MEIKEAKTLFLFKSFPGSLLKAIGDISAVDGIKAWVSDSDKREGQPYRQYNPNITLVTLKDKPEIEKLESASIIFINEINAESVFDVIVQVKPDYVWSDIDFGIFTADICELNKIKTVLFLESFLAVCPTPVEMKTCDKNCKGCNFYLDNINIQESRKRALQKADLVYTQDDLIAETVYKFYGKKVKVVSGSVQELISLFFKLNDKENPDNNKINVLWEGSQFLNHSFAIGNREIELELMKKPEIDLAVFPYEKHSFTEIEEPRFKPVTELFYKKHDKTDFTVRFKWPPDFTDPVEGKLVILQTWEAGSMPLDWLKPFSVIADEIWTTSRFNTDVYINSGIPEEKVFTIPFGINRDLYTRTIAPMELQTKAAFKFLFIGGTIHRKGIDLLLKAYLEEFGKEEGVCLVIKDIGVKNVYASTYREEIIKIIDQGDLAEIVYLDSDFTEEELVSLYKSCDAYVQPYRGEGFGMPIVEAMANGLPVIVPEYGPALEFCTSETSYISPVEIIYPSEKKYFETETVDYPFYAEIKIQEYKKLMRYVYENREKAKQKGKKAREYIFNNYTWEKSAEKVASRLKEIKDRPVLRDNIPYYTDLYITKAEGFLKINDFDMARKYYNQASILDETNNDIKSKLGIIEYKKNNYDKALQVFMKLLQSGYKNSEMVDYLVNTLEKLGDLKTAEIIRKKFLEV